MSDSRVLDVFGPNLVIESNGPVGLGGPIAYQLYSVTDKGAKWQQALHGSGLSSMEASHTLEIQTGKENKKGSISYMAMAHNGDMCMTAANGWIRIYGKNIALEASEELSPPIPFDPQVTTLPSLLRAAKAPSEGKMSITPEPRAVLTEELSPP